MKTPIKRVVSILCIIGSLYLFSGCTETDFLQDEDITASNESLTTRSAEESPYYFYDHENKKVYLTLNKEYAFLSVEDSMQTINRSSNLMARSLKTTKFRSDTETKFQYKGKVATDRFYTELNFEKMQSDEQYLALLSDMRSQYKDVIVAPYFYDAYGNKIGLSNFFYVKLKNEGDTDVLEEMVEQNACNIVNQDEFMPLWYKLSVTGATERNALECANLFHESGLFSAAEPDFMADNLACNTDPYYTQQWGITHIGIDRAWNKSTGSNIIVAVIDEGIDLSHPDLAANVYPLSYDCESGTTPQRFRGDGDHGTPVAGIIGAVRNNGIGIAGVAPNCRIMSISCNLTNTTTSTKEYLARAFNWARQNGADVINCSWSHPTILTGSMLTDAINAATSSGRSGKGCVVVVSTGNQYATSINYPSYLSNVLGVGSTDSNNRRAAYSNYGDKMNVVAPGVGIWSTDRQGSDGYNTASGVAGNYFEFGGTSAAAPFVSGVAALILSQSPALNDAQVRNAIEKTSSLLSGYPANTSYANGSYNYEIGYGLVNAYNALTEAKSLADLDELKTTPGIDFKIMNNSTYDLNGIYIWLRGKIGNTTTTLIQHDPGGAPARSVLEGFPMYPGNKLTATAGTAITNITLELYSSTWGSQNMRVEASIDTGGFVAQYINFNGGNTLNLSLPNSSVPSASRRTLTITVNPY